MTDMMKAVQIYQYGEPDVFTYQDAPRPKPNDDEVLIRVHAAAINPIDWKTRQGQGIAGLLQDPFPLILGWDVSGVIEVVGQNVSGFKIGDAVYSMVRFPKVGGAYAEYVTAPTTDITLKPNSLDHIQAAALPLVALTAWQALFEAADLSVGQRILIHAAAGGVGHIAVQLAKWKGAHVIGTASERNETYLQEIGVDEFINYKSTPFEEVVSDVDLVLDTMSGDTRERSWGVLKQGGILVSILGAPPVEVADSYQVRAAGAFVRPHAAQLTELGRLVDSGQVTPHVETVFPLKDVAEAHRLGQQGHTRGKIVLQVTGS